jgi:SPP1 family predicted phage head-tail adaptor
VPLSNKLQAGKLRHRIEIVQPSGAQDTFGGISQDPALWKSVLTCWASIDAQSGRDQMAASQFMTEASYKITIRNPRDIIITKAMYVWFKKRTFQLSAILNPDERNKMLVLMVIEINNSGQEIPTPSAGLV